MSSSLSKKKIRKFVQDFNIDMNEAVKSIDEFTSFNDFFYRELKKDSRIIDNDNNTIVSPSDGKILVFNEISKINDLFIKGKKFDLFDFLKDEKLAKDYKNGSMAVIRLAPQDYHRIHFPFGGYILEPKLINGYYYSVSPHALKNNINVFFENKREISILKTDLFDDIILIEVGATMVGGIKQTYTPSSYVKKGEEKGFFYFGGSTVVMLFKENTIKFDDDLINNTNNKLETKIYFGEKIGISTKNFTKN